MLVVDAHVRLWWWLVTGAEQRCFQCCDSHSVSIAVAILSLLLDARTPVRMHTCSASASLRYRRCIAGRITSSKPTAEHLEHKKLFKYTNCSSRKTINGPKLAHRPQLFYINKSTPLHLCSHTCTRSLCAATCLVPASANAQSFQVMRYASGKDSMKIPLWIHLSGTHTLCTLCRYMLNIAHLPLP